MGIGIVGSGKICATAARIFAEAGHEVTVSNSRGRESLASLVEEVGPRARAATVEEAADFGEVVLEAISRLVKAFNTMYYVRLHTEGRRRGGEGRRLAAHRGDRVRAGGHRLAERRLQARAGLAYPQRADGPGTTSTRDAGRYALMQDAIGAVNSVQRGRCEVVPGKIVAAKEA